MDIQHTVDAFIASAVVVCGLLTISAAIEKICIRMDAQRGAELDYYKQLEKRVNEIGSRIGATDMDTLLLQLSTYKNLEARIDRLDSSVAALAESFKEAEEGEEEEEDDDVD